MKTITKFICAAFATVTLVMGALTANGALNDLFASVDSGGNGGGFIYQFTPVGVQSTFASGVSRPRGVGYGKTGNLFVANNIVNGPMSEGYVVKITPDGVQSPFFTFSGNYFLEGLTLDQSGNVFVVALVFPLIHWSLSTKSLPMGYRAQSPRLPASRVLGWPLTARAISTRE